MDNRKKNLLYVSKYFEEDVPKKYLNYYNTATKLYLDGKIKQYRSLEKIVLQLSSDYYHRKAIKAIEKFEKPTNSKRIFYYSYS